MQPPQGRKDKKSTTADIVAVAAAAVAAAIYIKLPTFKNFSIQKTAIVMEFYNNSLRRTAIHSLKNAVAARIPSIFYFTELVN